MARFGLGQHHAWNGRYRRQERPQVTVHDRTHLLECKCFVRCRDNCSMSLEMPLHARKHLLPFCGVQIKCLDDQKNEIKGEVASGFLRREGGTLFLYTAWHVFTGFDPHHIVVGLELPKRRYISVHFQQATELSPVLSTIGGSQSVLLPLYSDPTAKVGPLNPQWLQNEEHIPHELLNHIGLFVPFWNDVVKIALPNAARVSDYQVINDDQLITSTASRTINVGDKCMIVGFPYGFSAAIGIDQPTPVVFTRFIASSCSAGTRNREYLLDGYGAPGMSGGPVFVEHGEKLLLFGIYTGDIFPDHASGREKTTALGTVSDLRVMFDGYTPLVDLPSRPISSSGVPIRNELDQSTN